MAQHHRQSSLESILDFSLSLFLPAQQSQRAQSLLNRLIQTYGLQKTIQKGYKPAVLIKEIFERVKAGDTFLRFFFSYIYDISGRSKELGSSPDFPHILSSVDDFIRDPRPDASSENNINLAVENFAEYIVDNFLFPRTGVFSSLDALILLLTAVN